MNQEQYVAAVAFSLRDLPWRLRTSLVADLRIHLAEMPAGEDLTARLGSPTTYAAELRAAEGLTAHRGPVAFLRARRPRNVAIATIILVMLAALAGGAAWGRGYKPLRAGNYGMDPDGHLGAAGEFVARFQNGKFFQYGLSVENTGRFAIRIVDVPLDPNPAFRLRRFTMAITHQGMIRPAVPFHPFTLKPGQQELILLRGRYGSCRRRQIGADTQIEGLVVRQKFLLWEHTVFVPMRDPIVVQNVGGYCR